MSEQLPQLSNPASSQSEPQTHPDLQTPTEVINTPPSLDTSPASAIAGGREISKNVLYVGGLDKSITEEYLQELMGANGEITSVKLLNDKNRAGFNYAFIEFQDDALAAAALDLFNGRQLNSSELRINFAFQSSTFSSLQNTEEHLFNIFVGDLSSEVDDEALYKFFAHFQSLKQAHVMWDMQTSRSRGYGFATFRDATDAELALQSMNGKQLLGRAVRCNWASHKQTPSKPHNVRPPNNQRQFRPQYPRFQNGGSPNMRVSQGFQSPGYGSAGFSQGYSEPPPYGVLQNQNSAQGFPQNNQQGFLASGPLITPQPYEAVLMQTPNWQTTVYLGNIAHFTQQNDLIPILQNFGYIVDFKFHPERGCAFVKYDSHERAALAIAQLAGFNVNGRPLRCGWGKARAPGPGAYQNFNKSSSPIFDGRQ